MTQDKLAEITTLLDKSSKITVFTGAGISTNCGIPDFRGENGLYSFVKKKYNLPYPEAIFDISYFNKNPEPFYNLSKNFFDTNVSPSDSHKFLAWLEKEGKISLVMTQNIDPFHQIAGTKKIIGCHGSYSTATCLKCNKKYTLDQIENNLKNGEIPYCECKGIIKPDITFFGEQLPEAFYNAFQNPPETDLLLVMGTSLTVQPAASFALKLAKENPSIIVNLHPTQFDNIFTHTVYEDLDSFCNTIWEKLKSKKVAK